MALKYSSSSLSQYTILKSVKGSEDLLKNISFNVEQIIKVVEDYLCDSATQLKDQLYTQAFSFILDRIQNIPQQEDNFMNTLNNTIVQFKREMFEQIAINPCMSLFDFMVSQTFNDLYDILTATQMQIRQDKQQLTSKLKNQYCYKNKQALVRSKSQEQLLKQPIFEQPDIEYAMMQQFIYDNINQKKDMSNSHTYQEKVNTMTNSYNQLVDSKSSPKQQFMKNREHQTQLFSFDSSFIKDLPLQQQKYVSNFDDTFQEQNFNFTLQQELLQQHTSRFDIQEEDYLKTESSDMEEYTNKRILNSTTIDSVQKVDQYNQKQYLLKIFFLQRYKQLSERERQIGQRELKALLLEKQLKKLLGKNSNQIMMKLQEQSQVIQQQQKDIKQLQYELKHMQQENRNNINVKNLGHVKASMYTLVQQMNNQYK